MEKIWRNREHYSGPWLTWKNFVWYLVNAHPIRRSSSCRASTLFASFSLGFIKFASAALMSFSVMAEKCGPPNVLRPGYRIKKHTVTLLKKHLTQREIAPRWGRKIGNTLWIFCTKTVRQINLRLGRPFYCILNYYSEFLRDSEKKDMTDTERVLKNNRVALELTKSTVRVLRNTERKRDS